MDCTLPEARRACVRAEKPLWKGETPTLRIPFNYKKIRFHFVNLPEG
jgi:hypothetical protein